VSSLKQRIADVIADAGGVGPVSESTGIGPRSLYDYMSGKSSPTPKRLRAFCDAAGITTAWLLTGRGPKYRHTAEQPPAQYVDAGDYTEEDFLTSVIQAMESALTGEKSLSPRQKARLISEAVKLCRSMDVEHHPERFKPIIDALLAVMLDDDR